MKKKKVLPPLFYKNLGKLFYAIAASDNQVEVVERNALRDSIHMDWQLVPFFNSDAQEVLNTFDKLHKEEAKNTEELFQEFVHYKKTENQLFSSKVNTLILQTATAIASSFSSKNKSELILLAKLEIALKKES